MSKIPYTSNPRPNPELPWNPLEALDRLKHVLDECKNEYQFYPSPVDYEALEYLRIVITKNRLYEENTNESKNG